MASDLNKLANIRLLKRIFGKLFGIIEHADYFFREMVRVESSLKLQHRIVYGPDMISRPYPRNLFEMLVCAQKILEWTRVWREKESLMPQIITRWRYPNPASGMQHILLVLDRWAGEEYVSPVGSLLM